MGNAANFSVAERKKYQRRAILSAWFGCVAEQLLDSNSLIILYLITLGGNESFSMFSTALSSICGILLLIPCAGLASRIGLRPSYSLSCYVSTAAFLMMAAAPSLVPLESAKYLVIASCMIYCLMRFPYSVSWYPMLDMILTQEERGSFFGKMRFSYILINAGIIYVIGKLLGDKPSIPTMQMVIAVAGLLCMGRKFCMDRMPDNPEVKQNTINIKHALSGSIRNTSLLGFSFYVCFFGMATGPAVPLSIIYMKTNLAFSAETIMTITSLFMIGCLTGYASTGVIMRKIGTRNFQITMHTIFAAAILGLATIRPETVNAKYYMAVLLWMMGVAGAFSSCLNSTEMMACSKPGNKIMANALCQTFTNLGMAGGRMGTTLILAAGVLAPDWKFFGINMTCYNFLFMFYFALVILFYLFLLLCPAIISQHDDYYEH